MDLFGKYDKTFYLCSRMRQVNPALFYCYMARNEVRQSQSKSFSAKNRKASQVAFLFLT